MCCYVRSSLNRQQRIQIGPRQSGGPCIGRLDAPFFSAAPSGTWQTFWVLPGHSASMELYNTWMLTMRHQQTSSRWWHPSQNHPASVKWFGGLQMSQTVFIQTRILIGLLNADALALNSTAVRYKITGAETDGAIRVQLNRRQHERHSFPFGESLWKSEAVFGHDWWC